MAETASIFDGMLEAASTEGGSADVTAPGNAASTAGRPADVTAPGNAEPPHPGYGPVQVIVGTVVHRRHGKSLAYADIVPDEAVDPKAVRVTFRSFSPLWSPHRSDPFPSRRSLLQHGCRVRVEACLEDPRHVVTAAGSDDAPGGASGDGHVGTTIGEATATQTTIKRAPRDNVVICWKVLERPSDAALRAGSAAARSMATRSGTRDDFQAGLASSALRDVRNEVYSKVARLRTATGLRPHAKRARVEGDVAEAEGKGDGARGSEGRTNHPSSPAEVASAPPAVPRPRAPAGSSGQWHHGDKRAKSYRGGIFASWLLEHFGPTSLARGTGVLEVAGGKGAISVELTLAGVRPCTVIDPVVRKKIVSSRDRRRLKKAQKKQAKASAANAGDAPSRDPGADSVAAPTHLAVCFGDEFVGASEDNARLVANASCIIGMHPDEATQPIVDIALQYQRSFAVVPCCVFSHLYPDRRLASGKKVESYEQYVQYLSEKDPRIRRTELPFEGRNVVLYMHATPETEQ